MTTFPKKIILLRHAEKPGFPGTDDVNGGPHLSIRGYCRAAALAPTLPVIFGRPDFIIASQTSAASNRPVETVTPLSMALSLVIDSEHPDKDYQSEVDKLTRDPKFSMKTVVICWHHGKIPELAAALGVKPPIQQWPETVFDRYWVITPDAKGFHQIEDLPQRLLYGDTAN